MEVLQAISPNHIGAFSHYANRAMALQWAGRFEDVKGLGTSDSP
jgi:hypothetical protein